MIEKSGFQIFKRLMFRRSYGWSKPLLTPCFSVLMPSGRRSYKKVFGRGNSGRQSILTGLSARELYSRLSDPAEGANSVALVEKWHFQTIEVRLAGLGGFTDLPGLLNKVRGALGNVLLAGASPEVRRGEVCRSTPCCAAEVFFAPKPDIDIGFAGLRAQIPKPFVLAAEKHGSRDLLIRMTVIGLAQYWGQAACEALVAALRNRVHWQRLAAGVYFVPTTIDVEAVRIINHQLNVPQICPQECTLSLITPLDSERTKIADAPQRILKKLLVRVAMMARWQGVRLSENLDRLYQEWEKLECGFKGPVQTASLRLDSSRNGQSGFRETSMLELTIAGDLKTLWPFLQIGQTTHIGRGAVKGLGRFAVL